MIQKIKVEWSSGYKNYFQFPTHKYRECFDYEGNAIEKSVSFVFLEFYETPVHVGLSIINIYGFGKF